MKGVVKPQARPTIRKPRMKLNIDGGGATGSEGKGEGVGEVSMIGDQYGGGCNDVVCLMFGCRKPAISSGCPECS